MGQMDDIVIVGAGAAGLSLAYHLRLPYHIYEKRERVGGLCRSTEIANCTFDYAPRVLLPGSPYTLSLCQKLLGDNFSITRFSDWSYHTQYRLYTRYPIQKHLYGLPEEVVAHCLEGLEEALRTFENNCNIVDNYHDWLNCRVGQPLNDLVITPQEQKKWKTDLSVMDYRWASQRVDRPDVALARLGATQDVPQDRSFGYTLRGGIAALMEGFAAHLSNLHLGVSLRAVDVRRRVAHFDDGSERPYRALVSTLPLPLLVEQMDHIPEDVQEAALKLEHVSLLGICMVVERASLSDKHFVYVHDPDIILHRVSFLDNLSPHMAPEGYSSLVAEVSYIGQPPMGEETLFQRVQEDLTTMGVLRPEDSIVGRFVFDLAYAYPRPVIGWIENAQLIRSYLEQEDIYTFGRFGEWKYLNIHHIVPSSQEMCGMLEERYA